MIADDDGFKCDICGVKRKTKIFLNANKSSIHGKEFKKLQYKDIVI